MTPFTWCGTCGTSVMSIILMISRTLSTGTPYSSSPRAKVRYLPTRSAAVATTWLTTSISVLITLAPWCSVSGLPDLRRLLQRVIHQGHEPARVENQPDASIAENRAPRHTAHFREGMTEGLDDDFLLAQQLVDQQADPPAVVFDDDQRRLPRLGQRAFLTEQLAQVNHREQRLPHLDQPAAALQRVHLLRRRPERLAHAEGRQHEPLLADAEQQALEDCQRERQLDQERGALAE